MKKAAVPLCLCAFAILAQAQSSHYVRPHVTRDGTYVEGHYQTNPDGNRSNNWSAQGNYNPYTGQAGTVDPFRQPPPSSTWPQQQPNSMYPKECGYNSRGQYVCR